MSRAVAELLHKKAQGDFDAAVLLARADPPMSDEIVGLHLQQAVEKATKALLACKNVDYPFTHDLATLLHLLAAKGCAVPARFSDLDMLTPLATQARYERAVPPGSFDRPTYVALVRDFLAWSESLRG